MEKQITPFFFNTFPFLSSFHESNITLLLDISKFEIGQSESSLQTLTNCIVSSKTYFQCSWILLVALLIISMFLYLCDLLLLPCSLLDIMDEEMIFFIRIKLNQLPSQKKVTGYFKVYIIIFSWFQKACLIAKPHT